MVPVLTLFIGCLKDTAWGLEYDLKVESGTEVHLFPESGLGEQDDVALSVTLKPDLALFWGDSVQITLSPRFRVGLIDPEYHLFSPEDVYIEYVQEVFEVRLGFQTFFWGSVESSNIVDILNQQDYVGDFLDPDKLGEPSFRVRFLIGKNRFDFFHFLHFTPAPLPGKVNRFNFFDGAREIRDDPFYTSASERFRQQFAIRWERTIGSADMGLSYFNGYEKFPVINVAPGVADAEVLYYEMQQFGADLQRVVGEWLIKGEGIFQETGIGGVFNRPSLTQVTRNLVPKDHAAFVAGVEYTFFGVVSKSDLGIIGEYLYDTEQDLNAVAFRPFQNDLFVGIRWSRNNAGDGELLGGLMIDLETQSQLWRLEYSERFFDRLKLIGSLDIIDADGKDPLSVFNNDDRVSVEFSYTF